MITNVFEKLASDDFVLSLGTHSTASSLRRCLVRAAPVRELREALASGRITEDGLRGFIHRLLQEFRPGEAFAHEAALSAIAVALETWNSDFARDFLIDLAKTKIVEFAMCRRVADLCARGWAALPKVTKIRGNPRFRYQTPGQYTVRAIGGRTTAVLREGTKTTRLVMA